MTLFKLSLAFKKNVFLAF